MDKKVQVRKDGIAMNIKLYVIIPCYNEEKVLPITSKIFL